jgi:hypothetical protein
MRYYGTHLVFAALALAAAADMEPAAQRQFQRAGVPAGNRRARAHRRPRSAPIDMGAGASAGREGAAAPLDGLAPGGQEAAPLLSEVLSAGAATGDEEIQPRRRRRRKRRPEAPPKSSAQATTDKLLYVIAVLPFVIFWAACTNCGGMCKRCAEEEEDALMGRFGGSSL